MGVRIRPLAAASAATIAGALALSACSPGSLGSSSGGASGAGGTTLSFLVDTGDDIKTANALGEAFHAKNPDITVKVESRPGGGEGDNIVKTRLATGEMSDIFFYNSGSLFAALNPEKNLTPMTDQAWAKDLPTLFTNVVKSGNDIYGAPMGGTSGGGILYNEKIYDQLGLKVPTTWAEFMANNAKIKAAGIDPVIQSYKDTWTSQVVVLGDYRNVAGADPDWASKFTANKVNFSTQPALAGFQRLQQVHDAGYQNKDFASMSYDDAVKYLAAGKGAHYPMLTFAIANVKINVPDKVNDIGYFGLPGDTATANGSTLWLPSAVYVPKTTTGAKLDAAKKFLTWLVTKDSCDVQAKTQTPSGPYVPKECTLPSDTPPAIQDLKAYVDGNKVTPALEFLSPVKGPNLEQITVEVGSGLKSAQDGAASYDNDVKKQAEQLGLPGW